MPGWGAQINLWRKRRWPRAFPGGWPYGFRLPEYSPEPAWLPGVRERAALGLETEPYWHVVSFALASRDSGDSQFLPTDRFAGLALLASTDQSGTSFKAQMQQVTERAAFRFSRQGINFGNCFGNSQNPLFLRRLYWAPDLYPIQVQVGNLTTATNNIQLVLYGVKAHAGRAVHTGFRNPQITMPGEQRALWPAAVSESAAARRIPVEKPPWIDLPASGQVYTYQPATQVNIPAQAAEITVVSFVVPNGKNGVITTIANQFIGGGWTEGTGNFTWRLEIDGVPSQGFSGVLSSLGSMSNPADFSRRPIRIREGQFVALIGRNVTVVVAGQVLMGLLGGYFYPLSQEVDGPWL